MTTTVCVDFSVIIPTRNRVAILKDLLETLAHQDTQGEFTFEVLVVDNGSTDGTRRMVEAMAASFPASLRCLREPQVGKPFAANAGIAQARAPILVFTDDDTVAEPTWLWGMWRCFRETDAEAVGGRVLPLWVDGRPEWLSDSALRKLGTLGLLDFGTERRLISQSPTHYWWVGSNIALRRHVIDRWGGFDVRRTRGQDANLFERYDAAGVRVFYEPTAAVRHKVGRERLTPEAFRAWYDRTGFYRAFEWEWKPTHLVTVMPVHCYREWARWALRWWRADRSPEAFWERLSYECRMRGWASAFRHRLRLWPRWLLSVVTGRSRMPLSGIYGARQADSAPAGPGLRSS
jgi:glycosyltransferase involved in cell wall biosynthesis